MKNEYPGCSELPNGVNSQHLPEGICINELSSLRHVQRQGAPRRLLNFLGHNCVVQP